MKQKMKILQQRYDRLYTVNASYNKLRQQLLRYHERGRAKKERGIIFLNGQGNETRKIEASLIM